MCVCGEEGGYLESCFKESEKNKTCEEALKTQSEPERVQLVEGLVYHPLYWMSGLEVEGAVEGVSH